MAKSTRTPAPRSRATASSTPGMGRPVSHTTPSRSTTQVPSGGGGHIGPRLTAFPRLGRRGRAASSKETSSSSTCARSRRRRASTATSACRSSAVTAVRVVDDPWPELRGMRAPGTGLPNVIAVGTRRGGFGKDFAAVHGNGPGSRGRAGRRRVRAPGRHRRRCAPGGRIAGPSGRARGCRPRGEGGRTRVRIGRVPGQRSAVVPGRPEGDGARHVAPGDETDDAIVHRSRATGPRGAGT